MSTTPNYSSDQASNSGSIPVRIAGIAPTVGSLQSASGTIAVASTSQQALSAASRKYLIIQNSYLSTANINVNFGSAAGASGTGSIELTPGSDFAMESSFVSSDSVNVWSTQAGAAFTLKWA